MFENGVAVRQRMKMTQRKKENDKRNAEAGCAKPISQVFAWTVTNDLVRQNRSFSSHLIEFWNLTLSVGGRGVSWGN